jgi:DNA modification methylase
MLVKQFLNPFLGSGTTLVVARDLGRNGIGYEINLEIAMEVAIRIKITSQSCSRSGEA